MAMMNTKIKFGPLKIGLLDGLIDPIIPATIIHNFFGVVLRVDSSNKFDTTPTSSTM
jgi:hypothetical protein